jgi:hypothetical protein
MKMNCDKVQGCLSLNLNHWLSLKDQLPAKLTRFNSLTSLQAKSKHFSQKARLLSPYSADRAMLKQCSSVLLRV